MNILAPVDRPGEIYPLSEAGASEFYCGYIPKNWIRKYNKCLTKRGQWESVQISINKRDSITASVQNTADLKRMVDEAESCDARLYLTLNALYYPEETYPELRSYLEEITRIGLHGLIVADPGLVVFLRDAFPKIKLILSCLTQVGNKWSNRIFAQMGISRITFPRHLSIGEIVDITNALPDMEYECFILDGKCTYDNGNCTALHCAGFFCKELWEHQYFPCGRDDFTFQEMQDMTDNEQIFNRWVRNYSVSGKREGWKTIGCSICALPVLTRYSRITALKLAGRGEALSEKVMMVRFVKKAVDMTKSGASKEDLKDYAKEIIPDPELCDKRLRCYMASLR